MENIALRVRIVENNLKYWQIAKAAGISPYTLSRWLRSELNGQRKDVIEKAVEVLINREETYGDSDN